MNSYWSITHATPLLDFFFLVDLELAPAAAAAGANSKSTKKKKSKSGVACVIDQYEFIRKSKGAK